MILLVVFLVGAVGYYCAAKDLNLDPVTVRRVLVGLLFAYVLSQTIVFAMEVYRPDVCNLYEKYSFMWYLNGCFWNESSS
jgi:hypothetical protein